MCCCTGFWTAGGVFTFSFTPLKRMLIVRGRLPCEATKFGASSLGPSYSSKGESGKYRLAHSGQCCGCIFLDYLLFILVLEALAKATQLDSAK